MSEFVQLFVILTCLLIIVSMYFAVPKLFEISETLKEIRDRLKNSN